MNEVQIPLKLTGIGSMKAELRSLKAEIAAATDPAQMEMLAKKAGELSDRIKDANDAVNVFASGSKFEQISNSFDGIKSSLMSLDFEEASEKSQVFANNLGKIGKADISGAIKGITGTIKTLGGAFVKLGVQILANPIFLLVAVITAIVVGIGVFLAKLGILQKAFDFLMIPVNALIDSFKRLTDWLGLTTYAAEENAAKTQKANEKAAESSKKRAEKIGDAYDIEIAKAKAAGKDTTDLEIAKSKAINKEAEKRYRAAQQEYAMLQKIANKDNAERRKKLREQMQAEKDILANGRKEQRLLQIEDDKEQAEKAKEAAAKRLENQKAYAKNRLDAARTIKDIEIALIENDNEREIAATNEKYKRLIEDVKKNENLTGKEKVELTKLYESQKQAELDKAAQVQVDAEAKRQAQIAQAIKDNQNAQLQREEEFQEQYRQLTMSDKERELDEVQTRYFELIALAEQFGLDTKELLEKQKKEQDDINKKYADKEKQDALDAIEKAKQVRDAKIQLAGDYAQSLINLTTLVTKDQKKLEKINKASALVQIGIDTAKAISSLVAASNSNALNGLTGGLAGAAQFATGILQITTNIAKAKQLLTNPSGSVSTSSGGGSSSSSSSSAAAVVPQVNLFGQGNNANTASTPTAVNAPQNFVVQAVVSETDITNTQNKIDKIKKGSEL
jgi:hypothetical protein